MENDKPAAIGRINGLLKTQRLMLTEDKGAETAAYKVGYESPTRFNREYKRQFGEPPRRDIQKLVTLAACCI